MSFAALLLYWQVLISICGCSILTPKAKGFASIKIFFWCSNSKISLALWPVAKIKLSASKIFPSAVFTEIIFSFSIIKSITFFSNKNSPPHSIIWLRIAVIICGNLLVPICGCASYKIFSSAPKRTNKLSMRSISPRLLLLV